MLFFLLCYIYYFDMQVPQKLGSPLFSSLSSLKKRFTEILSSVKK